MDVNFKPLYDFVLIDIIPDNLTAGGIAIPETAHRSNSRGRVVKAGPGKMSEEGNLIEMPVKEGDIVFMHFNEGPMFRAGTINLEGHEYFLVRARDLIGVQPN